MPALFSFTAWRLADVLSATRRFAEAEAQLQAARAGFEVLLDKHLLAFADHGAEFYAGSGGNPARAYELARLNLANRSTPRAFEQAYEPQLSLTKRMPRPRFSVPPEAAGERQPPSRCRP